MAEPIYQELLCDMPESDLEAEGGLWASKQEFIDLFGGDSNRVMWVVRFELVQVINKRSKADMRYRVRRSSFAVKLTHHKTKSQSGINSNIGR